MMENTAQRKTSYDVKAVFITWFKHYIMPELSIKYATKYIQLFKGRIVQTNGLFLIFIKKNEDEKNLLSQLQQLFFKLDRYKSS